VPGRRRPALAPALGPAGSPPPDIKRGQWQWVPTLRETGAGAPEAVAKAAAKAGTGGGASCRSPTPAPSVDDIVARRLAQEEALFRDPPAPQPVEVTEAWLKGIRSGKNKMSTEERRQLVARAAAEARAELMAETAAALEAQGQAQEEEQALGWEHYRPGRLRHRSQSRGSRHNRPRTPGRGDGEARPADPIFSQTWGVSDPGTMPPGVLEARAEEEGAERRRHSRPRSHSRPRRSQSQRRRSQSRRRWRGSGWWQGGWADGWSDADGSWRYNWWG